MIANVWLRVNMEWYCDGSYRPVQHAKDNQAAYFSPIITGYFLLYGDTPLLIISGNPNDLKCLNIV